MCQFYIAIDDILEFSISCSGFVTLEYFVYKLVEKFSEFEMFPMTNELASLYIEDDYGNACIMDIDVGYFLAWIAKEESL